MNSYDAILVDAGTGNLHSVYNALTSLGYAIHISSTPEELSSGGRLILPGVGAYGSFMAGLKQRNLKDALKLAVQRGDALLGICVGMQAFFEIGEEKGQHAGLGLLKGAVRRFPDFADLKVPHTGWNQLWPRKDSPLFKAIPAGAHAYFNHSFYCAPENQEDICTQTDYGIDFASSVEHENLFGVQFHPEKSQRVGRKLLENFFRI